MNILNALLGEHGVFYAQFDFLEEHLPDEESLEHILRLGAMLGAALESHARLENELLFTRIEAQMGTIPPVTVMRMEHTQIEGNLNELSRTRDAKAARELLLGTISLARSHFAKEEQVLFPMAGNALPAEVLDELGHAWAQTRKVFTP